MKLPIHITLLTLILSLVVLTGTAIGVTYYLNTREAVEDLSQHVLGHAEKRIDEQVNNLLLTALTQCELNRDLLESRRPEPKDMPRFASYWAKVMKQHRWFTMVGFTMQETGDTWFIRRYSENEILVVEGRWDAKGGLLDLRNFTESDYHFGTGKPLNVVIGEIDPRKGRWYLPAKDARKPVWTETFMLPNRHGEPDRPGLTCSIPVKRDGATYGVLSLAIELHSLCDFLKELETGEDGIPFIVEYKADGARSVIAHPDPDALLKTVQDPAGKSHTDLVPAESVGDPRVRSFLQALDQRNPRLVPADLKAKSKAELQDLARIRFIHDGVPYRGTYRCLSTDLTPDWLVCIIIPEQSILGRVEQSNQNTIFLVLTIGSVAVAVSFLVALQVARPLRRLGRQTEAIGQFHLAAEPIHHSVVQEVDRLAVAMEDMKTSLRSFRKYVPADVVRALLAEGKDASLGGEHRTISIYFSDIANFTSIAEQLTPEQLVLQLAEYFGGQSEQITQTRGTVDKYIGDAIMAFWGAPAVNSLHALAACTTAVRNQERLRALCQKWQAENKPPFLQRIGLHTGDVIVGNIGSETRLNYTVIGDAVNLASRLESLNKHYGTDILISEDTYLVAKDGVIARPLDCVSVKGKTKGVLVYELLALQGEGSPDLEQLVELFTRALANYRQQNWKQAIKLFERVLRIRPQDPPAQLMIQRCRDYQATPPPAGWDEVHRMDTK